MHVCFKSMFGMHLVGMPGLSTSDIASAIVALACSVCVALVRCLVLRIIQMWIMTCSVK